MSISLTPIVINAPITMGVKGDPGTPGQNGADGDMINPMTQPGDMIVGGEAGAPTRVGTEEDGMVWMLVGGVPGWHALPDSPGSTPEPTPTPTPSGSASPTPTPSGSATPTPTPSGSATPSPTPSATPTPSASATPSVYPTPSGVFNFSFSTWASGSIAMDADYVGNWWEMAHTTNQGRAIYQRTGSLAFARSEGTDYTVVSLHATLADAISGANPVYDVSDDTGIPVSIQTGNAHVYLAGSAGNYAYLVGTIYFPE